MVRVPEDIAQHIASTLLNWSTVDNFAGALLSQLYGLTDADDAEELVHSLDLRKKLDLIEKARKRGKIAESLYPACDALKHANSRYRDARNMVAHGMLTDHWGGQERDLLSLKGMKTLKLGGLKLALEQSRYAAAAMRIVLTGQVVELPPRPPERHHQQ